MNKVLLFSLSLLSAAASVAQNKTPAQAIYKSGTIYTGSQSVNRVEAIAIDAKGKIMDIGSNEEIESRYSTRNIIDLKRKAMYPGFFDAHCHFSGYALDAYKCDLTGTKSFEEILQRLQAYEKTNTLGWIYGRGWDQNDWTITEFPDKKELDRLFPDKPVILKRVDGHAMLCNQKALDAAGMKPGIKIEGGIVETKNGALTGILIDNAMHLVEKTIPELPGEQAAQFLAAMEQTCLSNGLTYVVDCGVELPVMGHLTRAYAENNLHIGLTAMIANEPATIKNYLENGPQKHKQFEITGIKVYSDGALGSRGACLLQDYSDQPGHRGMMLTGAAEIKTLCEKARKYGWQVATHAIGDSANRTVLKIYTSVMDKKNPLRWRIEHAQVVNPADYLYFREYNIIPSVQPTHAISDMPWAEKRLGKGRITQAYAYKQLLLQNGIIALGTDFPVEDINPIATFYTAVTRKDAQGNPKGGFLNDNAVSREEALKGMTLWAAISVGREQEKGTLEPGKDADFVILSQDIMTIPENEILKTKVEATVIGGVVVYEGK